MIEIQTIKERRRLFIDLAVRRYYYRMIHDSRLRLRIPHTHRSIFFPLPLKDSVFIKLQSGTLQELADIVQELKISNDCEFQECMKFIQRHDPISAEDLVLLYSIAKSEIQILLK
ncbi:MAG: hypothetical protein HYZ33_01800 [Ignavibacteriales bacterium]|nr:hypothetical protein [Ignavibacteriales bacterium]